MIVHQSYACSLVHLSWFYCDCHFSSLTWFALDTQARIDHLRPVFQVLQTNTARTFPGVEAFPIVFYTDHDILRLFPRGKFDVIRFGMPEDIGQGFLYHAEKYDGPVIAKRR